MPQRCVAQDLRSAQFPGGGIRVGGESRLGPKIKSDRNGTLSEAGYVSDPHTPTENVSEWLVLAVPRVKCLLFIEITAALATPP